MSDLTQVLPETIGALREYFDYQVYGEQIAIVHGDAYLGGERLSFSGPRANRGYYLGTPGNPGTVPLFEAADIVLQRLGLFEVSPLQVCKITNERGSYRFEIYNKRVPNGEFRLARYAFNHGLSYPELSSFDCLDHFGKWASGITSQAAIGSQLDQAKRKLGMLSYLEQFSTIGEAMRPAPAASLAPTPPARRVPFRNRVTNFFRRP